MYRALPEKMCLCKHAITMPKHFNKIYCEDEFLHLNFQLTDNDRSTKINFIKNQNYEVGKNILLNKLHVLNKQIEKSWMQMSLASFKIKCKDMFLC